MREYMSYGGGVQSTAIALLAINRDPRLLEVTGGKVPELYVFADTGDEPAEVYENVAEMQKRIEASGAIYAAVTKGGPAWRSLSDEFLTKIRGGNMSGLPTPPFWVKSAGKEFGAPIHRQCTQDTKIMPVTKKVREYFEIKRGEKLTRLNAWFGISLDETTRMRDSREPWRQNYYPLIEMGWRRGDCLKYIDEQGVRVTRSACVYCPFHSNREWQRLKTEAPEEFQRAVDFERATQAAIAALPEDKRTLREVPYLHKYLQPLDEIDFTGGQLELWENMDNECAGVCGV